MTTDDTDLLLEGMKRLYSIRNDIKHASDAEDNYSGCQRKIELEELAKSLEEVADKLKSFIFENGEFYKRG